MQAPHRGSVIAQGFARMRSRMLAHIVRRAESDHFAAGIAPFGTEVDQPVTGPNHIQVVFDHDQRMPNIQ